jgi:hypothetical protein
MRCPGTQCCSPTCRGLWRCTRWPQTGHMSPGWSSTRCHRWGEEKRQAAAPAGTSRWRCTYSQGRPRRRWDHPRIACLQRSSQPARPTRRTPGRGSTPARCPEALPQSAGSRCTRSSCPAQVRNHYRTSSDHCCTEEQTHCTGWWDQPHKPQHWCSTSVRTQQVRLCQFVRVRRTPTASSSAMCAHLQHRWCMTALKNHCWAHRTTSYCSH